MKVLVYGFGSMGKRHALNAQALGHEVRVVEPDDARHEAIVAAGLTVGSAKGWRYDARVIATPVASHAALVWERSKGRTLVEKPLALSVQDFWAPGTGKNLFEPRIGCQFRFQPHVRELKALLAAPNASPPAWAVVKVACDMATWPGRSYGDALLECGAHELDLVRHLLGPATIYGASCVKGTQSWELLLTCGKTVVTVLIDGGASSYARWIEIMRADGTSAAWAWHAPTGTSILSNPQSPLPSAEVVLQDIGEQVYRDELRAFLTGEWTAEGGATWNDGLSVLMLIDRARRLAAGMVA